VRLKELLAELDVEADRWSQEAMVAALASAKRVNPSSLAGSLERKEGEAK